MSYNRTVYCSWCGQKGHNRRSCEERKSYIRDNPHSYEAMREAHNKNRATKRRCSYCGGEGHTRRTCADLKVDKAILIERTIEIRRRVLDWMLDECIGIGALLKGNTRFTTPSDKVMFIDRIAWDEIRLRQGGLGYEISENLPQNWGQRFLGGKNIDNLQNRYTMFMGPANVAEVVGKVEEETIERTIPSGWKQCMDEKTLQKIDTDFKENDKIYMRTHILRNTPDTRF